MSENVTDLQALPTLNGDRRESDIAHATLTCGLGSMICCLNTGCVLTH